MKTCRRCGSEKPDVGFPPNSKLRDGLSSWCRTCHNLAVQQWRAQNPDVVEAYNADRRVKDREKVCPKCEKPFVVAAGARNWICESCTAAQRSALRRQIDHLRRLSPAGVDRDRVRNAKRRRIVQSGDLSAADVARMLRSRTFCPCCRKKMTVEPGPRQKQIDHIVPLKVGGTHTVGNVRVICRTCNYARPRDGRDVAQEALGARVA